MAPSFALRALRDRHTRERTLLLAARRSPASSWFGTRALFIHTGAGFPLATLTRAAAAMAPFVRGWQRDRSAYVCVCVWEKNEARVCVLGDLWGYEGQDALCRMTTCFTRRTVLFVIGGEGGEHDRSPSITLG